jgi:hypothetical protein
MNVQFDNKLVSSFLLFVDHEIQKKGAAFSNASGLFYSIASPVQGFRAYAAPYKQLCNDVSISGATVMSGLYLNNNLITIGQSGLYAINHYQGVAYFTGQSFPASTVISGNYAIKDFNVEFTDQVEYKLLFETKFVTNSKFNQTLSGLALDTKVCPAVFLRMKAAENKPFAFAGLDDNNIRIRAVIVTDNEFQKIGVSNILKNLNLRQFPIIASTPFDYAGNYTGAAYNYNNLTIETGYYPLIWEAKAVDVPLVGDFSNMTRNTAIIDFTISTIMQHP